MRWKWITAALCLVSQMSGAQILPGSNSTVQRDSIRSAGMTFERLLNTFIWNGSFLLKEEFDGMKVDIDQHVRSRLIRTELSSIQDEYEGKLRVSSGMSDKWDLRASVFSHALSDARATDLAKFSQHQVLGGVGYSFDAVSSVSALGGMELNSQENERDRGFAYSARLDAQGLSFEEIQSSVSSSWSRSFLGRRKPEHRNATMTFFRAFGPGASDSLTVHYDKLRREFYVRSSPAVQTAFQSNTNIFIRDAEVVDISNRLQYPMGESSRFSLNGGLLNRTIQRSMYYGVGNVSEIADPRIQESHLYGSLALTHALNEWAMTDIGISLFEREESHSTRVLNNVSRRTALTGDLFLSVSDDDSLRVSGSASIFRYDTPDSLNTDDRDELFITLGIKEVHRFNRFLSLTLAADVSLNHLVYLHRFQSASNNWNRVIRFSPGVVYGPSSSFRTNMQAEVLANYTVYDFEDRVASIRSFSFRQASWYDSTIIRSQRWELVVTGGVRLSERGILRWKEFQERPENFFVDKDFWPQVFFRPAPGFRVGLGFRYFSQDRFRYSGGVRVLDLELRNSGPTAMFQWFEHDRERVSIEGWRETQTVNGVSLTSFPNLTMRVSFGF